MIKTDDKKIEELLSRGVEQILPNREGLKKLMLGKKIRLYLGIDPTGGKLHLGHTIALRKLQGFAELGHEAILVIGTGTVLAGDPSQRDKMRPKISKEEIADNIKTWEEQAGKILDFSKVKIRYNGDWLLKLGLAEIIDIASNISAIKLFQRDMFQRRIGQGETVWTHETLYPLLQGYDSVALDVDLEIGGNDQVFNMLIGRELLQKMRNKEKYVVTFPMILGTDGKTMSKSSQNCVWLNDSPDQMYGKIMSIPDELTPVYCELLTNIPLKDISSLPPRDAKGVLANEIVSMYHGKKAAEDSEKDFVAVFKENKAPSKIAKIAIKEKSLGILDLLVKTKLAPSKAEAKRLIEQGGVEIGGEVKKDWRELISIEKDSVIRVGKRRFAKII